MSKAEQLKRRNALALKVIQETMILDQKELRKQIKTISKLVSTVNDEIGDNLVGAEQILETFEWLPKGEYTIRVKIQ